MLAFPIASQIAGPFTALRLNRPAVDGGLAECADDINSPVYRASRCKGLSRCGEKPHEWGLKIVLDSRSHDPPSTAGLIALARERAVNGPKDLGLHLRDLCGSLNRLTLA